MRDEAKIARFNATTPVLIKPNNGRETERLDLRLELRWGRRTIANDAKKARKEIEIGDRSVVAAHGRFWIESPEFGTRRGLTKRLRTSREKPPQSAK